MRLVPETLFGRLVTALLAVVAVTAVAIVLVIDRERREMVFWGGDSSELIAFLAATTEELAALPADERARRVEALGREPLPVSSGGSRPPRHPLAFDDAAAARTYQERLQRELGAGYTVRVRPARAGVRRFIRIRDVGPRGPADGPPFDDRPLAHDPPPGPPPLARGEGPAHALDVAVGLPGGGTVAYRVPAPRSGPPLPRGIFLELAVLTAVLALVLFLMARSITRPLSALARAAEAMSRGETPAPLAVAGARELREATHAFNTMHERLQRYLSSRTQLLAAMSHDLRTPLTRLLLRAERIPDAELRARFVKDVNEMTAMIQATLDLFRGMNGQEALTSIDVMRFLDDLRGEFAEMGAHVTLEGSVDGPFEGKPDALKRCLANLVTNAVKYGERAAIRVSDGDALVIRVQDDGPGIPDEQLEKVFEPFFRLESSRNPESGGTGLGLSIARDVAQLHGGTLELQNREAGGLEAILTLPRARR